MELSQEIIEYVEKYKNEYERRYDIKIYYWFVRKSTLRGLGRRTSDLDVTFIFKNNSNEKRSIIFERADRRNEFQCWDIEVLLDTVVQNRKRVQKSKEFEIYNKDSIYVHYVLDYYNGFYCSFGNSLRKDYCNFLMNCEKTFLKLYEPLVASKICYQDYISVVKKVNCGYMVSLNQYLNALWSGLAGIHFLKGGMPGDVKINDLARCYLNSVHADLTIRLVQYFRGTVQKQSNYCNLIELNSILASIEEMYNREFESYEVLSIDIDKEVENIRRFIDR